MLELLTFIFVFLLSVSAGEIEKQHLYVKPTPTSTGCPQDEVCMTFSDYLQNASDYFTSNTAIHFLPGNHTIKSNEPSHKYNCLLVSDVHNLSLSGYTGVTTLRCIERFGLAFVNATELRISDIINCGQTITCTASVLRNNYFVEIPESTKAALTLVNLHSLVLQNVQIQASYGYGLIGVNVLGNSTITNCTFTHNMWRSDDANTSSTLHHSYARPGGNVLLLFTDPESQQFKDALYISQCEFAHGTNTNTFTTATNSLDFPKRIDSCSRVISWGSGLGLLIYKPLVVMKINIINSVFHHNNASYGAGANMFIAFCGTERKSCSIDISNCTFYGGKAVQGGGIYIGSSSGEIAFRLSHSTIINNSAMSGGGLNIEVEQTYSNFRIANCVFSGNKAMQGAAIYIAHYPALWELWEDLGPNTHINVSQTIFLQNIADNASPALVQTRIISDMDEIFLGERQNFQELGRDCSPLVYLFDFSRKKVSSFQLHISIEGSSLKTFPAVVNVTVLNCPPGFELSSDLSTCQCEPHLEAYGIRCDIDTQKFTWPAPMWIGYYKEQQVAVHTNCPFHYCKPEDNEFTLDNQDKQCAFNRSGVLCGACQQGLSLALGTSQCLKCSNVYLLLLIPFALAGVVLVFLLLKCNLTVAVGSINGLIFYVNIVQINYATFFPQGAQNMTLLTKFLSIFVAWLNLDLGIQMCFSAGLNAYTKTWLQFVFPVYVWIMVGFMIYGSRYYPTVARLIGSNAVQVLATLFLLSYAKLLRTVIAVFYSTTLVGKNSSTPLVWLLDGNVLFFRGTHIALLVMAFVIILLYIVPFTILVLLAPCLQAKSNHTIARLVNIKLKPLLDAYQGPYKDSFRYWTGLMLLVRTILFSAFAGNVLGKPEIDLFAVIVSIVLVVILYWNSGRVYKKRLWHIAESFYLLNLVILTAATSLLRSLEEPSSSTRQEIVTDVMVGTAFIVFCAIVLYHFCVYVLKTSVTRTKNIKQAVQSLLSNKFRNREQPTIGVNPNTSGTPNNIHTVSHLELNLREPLLSVTN